MAFVIKTHTWDDGYFDFSISAFRIEFADRFLNVKTSLGKVVLTCVFPQYHVCIAYDDGQENLLALGHQFVYPFVGVHLVGEGVVKEEGMGCLYLGMIS